MSIKPYFRRILIYFYFFKLCPTFQKPLQIWANSLTDTVLITIKFLLLWVSPQLHRSLLENIPFHKVMLSSWNFPPNSVQRSPIEIISWKEQFCLWIFFVVFLHPSILTSYVFNNTSTLPMKVPPDLNLLTGILYS